MSHYCPLCGRYRPGARFSARANGPNVCRDCKLLPTEERLTLAARIDIETFLFRQSHISKKNRERLRQLCQSPAPEIATLAGVVLQIATIAPSKKKRFRVVRRVAPHLVQALVDRGLLEPFVPLEDFHEIAQLDGWIPEEAAGVEIVPPSPNASLRDDVPF